MPFNATEYEYLDYFWPVQKFDTGLNKDIMDSIFEKLLSMLELHPKVLMVCFEIHTYEATSNNKLISKLFKQLTNSLEKHYSSRMDYLWVREQTTAEGFCHYHCIVIIDAQKVRNSFGIKPHLDRACYLLVNVSYYFPTNCNYWVHYQDKDSFLSAIFRASYLAKNETKEYTPKGIRKFQGGRKKRSL